MRPRRLLAFLVALAAALALPGAAHAQPKRKVAFLVGVGEFKHLPNLDGLPQRDVAELGKALAAGGFRVVTLTDEGAKKADVEAKYKAVLEGTGDPAGALGKDDLILVALCTHGFTAEGVTDGVKKQQPYMAAYDSRAGQTETLVPLNGLIETAKPYGTTTLFLIDACREQTDPNRGAARGFDSKQVTLSAGTAVLFSCGRGELAYQHERLRHGLFTHAVLKTLRGETGRTGDVSWGDLVTEVQRTFQTAEFRGMLPAGRKQTPVQASGEVPYTALLTLPDRPPPPPPPPAGVSLASDLKVGDVFYVKMETVLDAKTTTGGETTDTREVTTIVRRIMVKEVGDTYVLGHTFLDVKVTGATDPDANAAKFRGATATITLDKSYDVVSVTGHEKLLRALGPAAALGVGSNATESSLRDVAFDLFGHHPGRSVQVGDSWTKATSSEAGGLGKIFVKLRLRLDAADADTATIRGTAEYDFKPGDGAGLPFKLKRVDYRVESFAFTDTFDRRRGRFAGGRAEATTAYTMTVEGKDQDVEVKIHSKVRTVVTVSDTNPLNN